MIEIQNFRFSLAGSTFDVLVDGQKIEGARTTEVRGLTKVILPQSAGSIGWGDHSIADVELAIANHLKG